MTIKIISTRGPAEANLEAVEREEHIQAVAKVIAGAWGKSTPFDVDECASKLRGVKASSFEKSIGSLALSFSKKLSHFHSNPCDINTVDLDIERVMKLLEG